MFKMLKHTPEEKEVLKIHWIEMFENMLRDKRLETYEYDYGKTTTENQREKWKLQDLNYNQEEIEKLKIATRKIEVALSFDQFIEVEDLEKLL